MKTLFEIVESARDGVMPSHEECYWAMLALDAISHFDRRALMDLANRPSKLMTPQWQYEESFRRHKAALNKDPKSYVGWNNDPSNPEFQKRRKVANKILDRALSGELKKRD